MGLAVRIIPVLLKRGDALVKGERFKAWRTVGHVLQAAKIHQARSVDELIVLDIGATPAGTGPDFQSIKNLTQDCFMPLTVGGGVKSVDDVVGLLHAGADKVAIKTAGAQVIAEASRRLGSQAIVAAVDIGKESPKYAAELARYLEHVGAGEILLTSMEREGTCAGYDYELIYTVTKAVSVPVVAHGGCGSYQDMVDAIEAGASAVAAGALFQFTEATPREAALYLSKFGIETRIPVNGTPHSAARA